MDQPKTVTINGKEVVKKSKKQRKNPIGEDKQTEPIATLGFGIVAYLDMLWCLIWTFTLYTIFLLPTMMFFSSGTAYAGVKNPSTYLNTYIGNLGYASVQCMQIPENVGSLVLSCPYGTIGEIHDYGINPTADTRLMCANSEANQNCKPTSAWVDRGL